MADDGIPFAFFTQGHSLEIFRPAVAKNRERKGGQGVHAMIGAVHDELDSSRESAEFADDQLVADKIVVVKHVAFEVLGVFRIVIIGVVTNFYVGVFNGVLYEADPLKAIQRVFNIRIGSQGNGGASPGTSF